MAQKFIKSQNKNSKSIAFGKYFATAVYDEKFITTEQIADFIQQQCSIKKSDIKAALDELGGAMKHFFELGQKIRLDGIGIFKVGFSSIGVNKVEDCSAATITERRILFQPETERVVVGQTTNKDGKIVQKYVVTKSLIKDVLFEETHENTMKKTSSSGTGESEQGSGNGGNTNGGSTSGGNTNGGSTGGNTNGGYYDGGGDGGDDLDKG
jgi:predicted histone-like DNA-binding protein